MHSPTENATQQPLLNQIQAAEMLAVQPRTMESWRCRGGGPPFVRVGRRVRYRLEDLQAWIEDQTYRSTTDAGHRPGR